ncbi:MAG: hypothetical protein FJ138_13760 [Deltaproteobacteria bacterium]|nr:hypothetical protein [Deltaproteobacteria bacterium]
MRHTTHAAPLALIFTLSACDLLSPPAAPPAAPISGARGDLLSTLAHHTYPRLYSDALTRAEELNERLASWEGAPSEEARAAWRALALAWQRAELAQVGPAGASGLRVGGRDLRDLIYAYPLHNPCRVDQELVANDFSEPGWAGRAVISARGLDALERLLFTDDDANACASAININRDGTWAALSPEDLAARRAGLARVLSADLAAQLTALRAAWAGDGESARALAVGDAPFSSAREALDQVYAALLYLDKVSRDLKLAIPLGVSPDCAAERCPELLEHAPSGLSRDALIANLEGFLLIFEGRASLEGEGGEGEALVGFDDVLAAEGAGELAADMSAKARAVIEALRPLNADLALTLRDDPDALLDAYEQLRALTTLLKSQLATVLNLSLPMEGAGDND